MMSSHTRRYFLGLTSLVVPAAISTRSVWAADAVPTVNAGFPTQPPELVEEMVVVSHANLPRVKELLAQHPTLAKSAWDWGFGDWETALGAASHIGNRQIAELLLANGAHPTIFSAAMLGQLDAVKAFISASPGIQRTRGPHSISLLAHAMAGGAGAQPVVEYLKSVQGADDKLSVQPLTDADVAKLSGVYTFGIVPADRFEITATNNRLQIARPGRYGRGLMHVGAYEFAPVGAESVRVKFADGNGGVVLTVHDPDVVLTARKSASTQ